MTNLDLFWKSNPEWFERNGFNCKIKPDAPKEAQESYQNYLRQKEKKKEYFEEN